MYVRDEQSALRRNGYILLRDVLHEPMLRRIDDALEQLLNQARDILSEAAAREIDLESYYRTSGQRLIVVPEISRFDSVCRIEYLAGSHDEFSTLVENLLLPRVEELFHSEFSLFKDKCNLKSPGGGAFPPHQDVVAYRQFGPTFHVTAMVALDAADDENGCLQIAANYHEVANHWPDAVEAVVSGRPVFRYGSDGDERYGDIDPDIVGRFRWRAIELSAGDVVFFDSFVPHYSDANKSRRARRALFMTFNRCEDGDHYESYYARKRAAFSNPAFHVATPTNRGIKVR
jgi:2-aminoethylphosphonate dioxygenase